MTIQNNNFIYYDRSKDQEWNKLLFLANRMLQSAELNEIQSMIEEYQARVGRTIFKDGDIISGCQIKTNTTAKELYISDGYIFIDGKIRKITGKSTDNSLSITCIAEEKVGLILTINYLTEADDVTLRDPIENWGIYGNPGAHRELYNYEWVVNDETAVTIYTLNYGTPKVIKRYTQYSEIYDRLAKRTFDESGSYALNRFLMRAETHSDSTNIDQFMLVVEPSKAYVKGYEIEFGGSQKFEVDKARNYRTITAEFQIKGAYSNLYELNDNFIKKITLLDASVFKETNVSRGGTPGGKDMSPYIPLFKIFEVNQGGAWDGTSYIGGVTYTEGVDYYQEGNYINWSLGGIEPYPGSTYRAAFLYTKRMDKGIRSKVDVDIETLVRDATAHIDWLTNEDGVQYSLEFVDYQGNPLPSGTYKEGSDYEFITGNNPEQVFYTVNDFPPTGKDYANTIGKTGVYWYPNANNKPSGSYYVKYSYWKHTTEGDYISADSFSHYENITINEQIPLYYRDFVDFRPTETISKTSEPYDNEHFSTTYNYYVGRSDLICLDQYGNITVKRGTPSLQILRPYEIEGTLTIGWADIPPYTYSLGNIDFTYKDNVRFTMQDIHRLEDRINRLEYFMLIDILQQNAMGQFTSNPKKGVFVDAFQGSKNADLEYNDGTTNFSISFDQRRRTIKLQPEMVQKALEIATSTTAQLNEKVYTLPFTEKELASQPFATNSMTVQPFGVFEYVGELTCDPEADVWVDTEREPEILANFEDENAHIVDMETQWNIWQDVSVGEEVITSRSSSQMRGRDLSPLQAAAVATSQNWSNLAIGALQLGNFQLTTEGGFTSTTQERIGTRNQLIPENVTKTLGDRVVNAGIIPFIRAQTLTITGEGLEPNIDGLILKIDEVELDAYDENPSSSYSGKIKTDSHGSFTCKVNIPAGTFRIGRREIRIGNQDTASTGEATYATCIFEAYGLSQRKQDVTASVTILNHRTEEISERRVLNEPLKRESWTWIRPPDPLAQSFITDPYRVTYISSIDIYFRSKDTQDPVMVMLGTMDNGYPTTSLLSQKTLNPSQVNISEDGSVATRFNFPDPVMVDPGTELCFIVYSGSKEYRCFYSELGETDIATGTKIIKNPYVGVMFTSANQSSWQADGFKDLKFVVNKCNFENDCQLVFENLSGFEAAILILQTSQIMPDATEIKWFYSVDKGAHYLAISPLNNTFLTTVTDKVLLRADITGTGLSPMIHKDRLGIVLVKHKTEGDYITKKIELAQGCTEIKLVLDKNLPDDTEIEVWYQVDEDNTWRNDWDTSSSSVIDIIWSEFTYNKSGLSSFTDLRIRINFKTSNQAVSSEAKRLRVICS